jgi:NMD protein affecting ribosome stability and mRNA decay
MDKIEHTCLSCDMEYKLKSIMAVIENVQTRYCPYCGTININDLDFEDDYKPSLETKEDFEDDFE